MLGSFRRDRLITCISRPQDEKELVVRGTTMLIKQWRVGWQCAPNCQIHGDPSICDAGRVGTGTMLWECGIVLGKYLEKCPEALRTVDAAAASRERSGWNRGKNHGRKRRARAGRGGGWARAGWRRGARAGWRRGARAGGSQRSN